jgi:rod shape-determining protein MreC
MQNFFLFFIRFKVFWVFFLFEVLAIVLVFNGNDYHRAAFINSANNVTGGLYQSASDIGQYFHLKKVNRDLQEENAKLRTELSDTDYVKHNADTITVQDTAAKYKGRYLYIAADVIGNSTARRNNYLILNAGSKDGVTRQCGVISDKGVVGIVLDVSDHFCTVISLLNSNTHISVKIDTSNSAGTLTWNGHDPQYAQVDDINKHVKVEAGQTLSTSGFNSIFPRGIAVGTIQDYMVEGNFNRINISLSTPFETLRYVYIVKNLDSGEISGLLDKIKDK